MLPQSWVITPLSFALPLRADEHSLASRRSSRADGRAPTSVGVTGGGIPEMTTSGKSEEMRVQRDEGRPHHGVRFFESLMTIDKCTSSEG